MKAFAILCFAFATSLVAVPIRVPIEYYAGHGDNSQLPGHYPFISHLTFRNISDLSIESRTEWFDPDEVKRGDIIYVNVWYVHWFFKEVHDRIEHPYILLCGDVGAWLPSPELKRYLYDPKLAAWFCRNMLFSYHPKLHQIPMGQDYTLFGDAPDVTEPITRAIAAKSLPKKHLLYMNHLPRNHGSRLEIIKLFEHEPYCFSRNFSDKVHEYLYISRNDFYQELSDSKFVISPLGLETDCVRTWEALVLDCIPIVEHTFLDPLFDRLPVLMIHDWKEINQPFLEKKYLELKDRKTEEAYFDYWWNLIRNTQEKVRNGENTFSQLEATEFSRQDLEDLGSILNLGGPIYYKGFLSTVRPLQLSNVVTGRIYLFDPWLEPEVFDSFGKYIVDSSLLDNDQKISVFKLEAPFLSRLCSRKGSSLFLDLSYYRSSIFIDFSVLRHRLKQDLADLYNRVPFSTRICGNMVKNSYVKECLDMFAAEQDVHFEVRGDYWIIDKGEKSL